MMKNINTKLASLLLLLTASIEGASGLSVINPATIQSLHDVSTSVTHVLHHSPNIIASTTTQATNLLDVYKEALAVHPLPTKMITGGTLAVAGDAIAQSRDKDESYNKRRAGSFMAFDMCYRALQHVSFPIIVQQCHGQYIGGVIASIPLLSAFFGNIGLDDPSYYYGAMEQTLASQLGIVPFMYYPVFYVLTAFVQGLDAEGAVKRAQETFVPLMKRNLLFWIPVQFIQFSFIEESLQIPFLAVCGLAWTFIISLFAGNARKSYNTDDNIPSKLVASTKDAKITMQDVQEIEQTIIDAARKEESLTDQIVEEKELVMR